MLLKLQEKLNEFEANHGLGHRPKALVISQLVFDEIERMYGWNHQLMTELYIWGLSVLVVKNSKDTEIILCAE